MKLVLFFFSLIYFKNAYSQTSFDLVSKLSPGVLWIGVEDILTLTGDTINKNVFLNSNSAEVWNKNGSFGVIVKAKDVNTYIRIDACSVVSQDTTTLVSKEFYVKMVPNPTYSIDGKIVDKVISRMALLNAKKIDVVLGDGFPDGDKLFLLTSFDLEIDGKVFHSDSNTLTTSMIKYLVSTKSKSIRLFNDMANGFNETRLLYKDKTWVLDD